MDTEWSNVVAADAGARETVGQIMYGMPRPIYRAGFRQIGWMTALAFAAASLSTPVFAAPDVAVPEVASLVAAAEPPAFDTPEAALEAFKQAIRSQGSDAVAAVLGLDPAKLKADENIEATLAAIHEGVAKQLKLEGDGNRRSVLIGDKLWPLPFPIVKGDDGKWAFATFDGLEEIVNRRVGENELSTIETMRGYVDAQEDYASEDRDDDRVEEFAQKLVSTEGTTDGLYWPADGVNPESPAGDLDQAELNDAAKGEGYFGYKYKKFLLAKATKSLGAPTITS